jgi:hypothetical protein
MQRRLFQDAALEALRGIGDPGLDSVAQDDNAIASYFQVVGKSGVDIAFEEAISDDDREEVAKVVAKDVDDAIAELTSYGVDPATVISRARGRFTYFGDEVCASLLLAGLPDAYATAWGSRVLVAHGDLVWALPRRVRETAMFLMTVLSSYETEAGKKASDTIVEACAPLRLFHEMLRKLLRRDEDALRRAVGDENAMPINQEDLLGTLLTFTITTFDVLDRFGVKWNDDDREAYLLFWDIVGAALGIGTGAVSDELSKARKRSTEKFDVPRPLRPRTVLDATRLLDQVHGRQWLPVQQTMKEGRPFPWSGFVSGRMLIDALLDALSDAMPPSKKMWPSIVMRELAPPIVQERLGLDSSGLSTYAARWIADRSRYAKYARASSLRMMANDITRHAMQSFLRADGPPFVIPGLNLSELTTNQVERPSLGIRSGP